MSNIIVYDKEKAKISTPDPKKNMPRIRRNTLATIVAAGGMGPPKAQPNMKRRTNTPKTPAPLPGPSTEPTPTSTPDPVVDTLEKEITDMVVRKSQKDADASAEEDTLAECAAAAFAAEYGAALFPIPSDGNCVPTSLAIAKANATGTPFHPVDGHSLRATLTEGDSKFAQDQVVLEEPHILNAAHATKMIVAIVIICCRPQSVDKGAAYLGQVLVPPGNTGPVPATLTEARNLTATGQCLTVCLFEFTAKTSHMMPAAFAPPSNSYPPSTPDGTPTRHISTPTSPTPNSDTSPRSTSSPFILTFGSFPADKIELPAPPTDQSHSSVATIPNANNESWSPTPNTATFTQALAQDDAALTKVLGTLTRRQELERKLDLIKADETAHF